MKPHWQREQEAMDRLGFVGVEGSADRRRAVETVMDLLREIETLRQKPATETIARQAETIDLLQRALRLTAALATTDAKADA